MTTQSDTLSNTPSPHPADDLLSAYIQQPDMAHPSISLHIASCSECRTQVALMSALRSRVTDIPEHRIEPSQQQITDEYLYSSSSPERKHQLQQQIKNDPTLLHSALHSLTEMPAETIQHEAIPVQPSWLINKLRVSIESCLWQYKSSWLAIPASVILTVFITLWLMPQQDQDRVTIAAYQDSNVVRFVDNNKMPGIGFFSSATQHTKPYQNIRFSLVDNQRLKLEWLPILRATSYDLTLYRFQQGKREFFLKTTTTELTTVIKVAQSDYNQRLEWTLTGQTEDQKTFITTGGFILHTAPQAE